MKILFIIPRPVAAVRRGSGLALLLVAGSANAHPQPEAGAAPVEPISLESVEVRSRAADLTGVAGSASQGWVGRPEFQYRPLSRAGELVEVIPGTLATQHSGTGKANQFFLRGFNLDHGTDFSVTVDGVPMNLPSHAHGQGYLDLNSVIPELVDQVEFGKGPYYADAGDFSSAGYARMHTLHRLPEGFVKFTGGEFDFYRVVAANSQDLGGGHLLYGGEAQFYEGPWDKAEQLGKYNGMVRYSVDGENSGYSLVGKAYRAKWDATNQIAGRAVDLGLIAPFGSLDRSDGGDTHRYSVSGNAWSRGDGYRNEANLYAVYYDLDLYSNFTYFLDDPERGDQIGQKERRVNVGGNAEQTWFDSWFGLDLDNTLGVQVRHDQIDGLALTRTERRRTFATVRRDDVAETSLGVYAKTEIHWAEKFRTLAGLRGDFFFFDVRSRTLARNSGDDTGALLSPKVSFIFGPWFDTEFFVNTGYGYHSNDARGTTLTVDPATGRPGSRVDPLVRSRGWEVGLRTLAVEGLNSTLAFWWMQLESELVFVGDAGTTEAGAGSERYGVEWTNYYKPTDWLTLDADFAFTTAYYRDAPADADRIPNSVGRVIGAGATVELPSGLFGSLRLRHFGDVPLVEDDRVNVDGTTLVNLAAGYQYRDYRLEVDVFNLLDSEDYDIAYYYDSRLPGEPAGGVGDIHYHPVEPRQVRVTASVRF
jgi:hypothetical protein